MIYRIPPRSISKWRLKLMHTLLHSVALLFSAVGLKSVWDSKSLRSMSHAYSLHSWIGIAAVALFFLQFLAGFTIFLLPPAPGYIRVSSFWICLFWICYIRVSSAFGYIRVSSFCRQLPVTSG